MCPSQHNYYRYRYRHRGRCGYRHVLSQTNKTILDIEIPFVPSRKRRTRKTGLLLAAYSVCQHCADKKGGMGSSMQPLETQSFKVKQQRAIYAKGNHTRGSPQLSGCMLEALLMGWGVPWYRYPTHTHIPSRAECSAPSRGISTLRLQQMNSLTTTLRAGEEDGLCQGCRYPCKLNSYHRRVTLCSFP